ncbi:TetR/AcrR family transcriptional regulator [Tomitella gaofuii]|uniref:TetR/AcrR family transcriptional regulator n=1 Tax=Tomitella gaofuii TaxID=2760083 RepID=UPI0015FC8876|nr:TetR/AcrR family transcriptional regulator [Tomitella gaofuii]
MTSEAGTAQRPPVRVPTQKRAKRTVASILDATADLLVAGGMDAVNTNAVAKAAGVNVSTLYAYFPDKTAIVAQLAQRFEDERAAYVSAVAPNLAGADWREWFAEVIDRLARFRVETRAAVAIRKAVMGDTELRHIDQESTASATEKIIGGLRAHNPALTEERARLIGSVVVRTITEIVDAAFAAEPPDSGMLDELKLLVVRYLEPYLHDSPTS